MFAALKALPKTITTILAMLVVLALVSTVSAATSRIGVGNRGNRTGGTGTGTGTGGGNFQGNNNSGGNFQGNNNGGQTDNGTTGTTQRRTNQGGFNLFSLTRSLGISPQVMVYVNLGITILGILLVLLSAYGIWKQKIWGLNLATVMAIIFLIGAVPSLFSIGGRFVNWLRIGENVISTLATLPILGLSLLPSVRDYFPKPKSSKPKTR